jgi:hypothetical protein
MELGTWPTRSTLPQADRFAVALQRFARGVRREIDTLEGGRGGRGWPWHRVVAGVWHCGLRVAGRIMALQDGKTTVDVNSVAEAIEFYKRILAAVEEGDGELYDMISQHVALIPPRVRRN